MKREKTKALLVFIGLALLVAVDLYSEDKFKVIQQNNNAILSEYYYPLPLSATNNIDVQNNTMQIINRFSNKALEKHKETLLTRVVSTVSSTAETKGLNGLSSFKQTGKIESSLQIFNVKVQNEGLVESTVNDRTVLKDTSINPDLIDEKGRTNLERMEKGLAPIDENGKPYNLHHIGQNADSLLALQ